MADVIRMYNVDSTHFRELAHHYFYYYYIIMIFIHSNLSLFDFHRVSDGRGRLGTFN